MITKVILKRKLNMFLKFWNRYLAATTLYNKPSFLINPSVNLKVSATNSNISSNDELLISTFSFLLKEGKT